MPIEICIKVSGGPAKQSKAAASRRSTTSAKGWVEGGRGLQSW